MCRGEAGQGALPNAEARSFPVLHPTPSAALLPCSLSHTPAVHLNSLGTVMTFGGVCRRKHAAAVRLPLPQRRAALSSCATPHTLSCFVALLTFSHSRSPSQLSGHGDDIWGRVSQEACRSCAATSAPTQSRALFLCYTPHPQLLCCLAHTPAVHLNSLGTATKLTTFGGVLSYDSRRKHAAPARLPPTFGVHLSISERFAVLSDVVITMSMSNIVNPPNKVPSGCDSSCHRHSTTTACRHLSCR